MSGTGYMWTCCYCGDIWGWAFNVGCLSCHHIRCDTCAVHSTHVSEPGYPSSSVTTLQPHQQTTVMDLGQDSNNSHAFDLGSDKGDLDSLRSSVEEAADEKQPKMDERPNLVLESGSLARVQVVEAQSSFLRGESQNSMTPKEPWQEITGNTPEDFERREEEEKFENDSLHSDAYSSTDLESSSSTFDDEVSDAATHRIPGDWEIEDTDERTTREEMEHLYMTPDEDLRMLPWLLGNLFRVWRWLQQDWQDFWTATPQSGEQSATSTPSGLITRQERGPSGGKRRRERMDPADEAERDKPPTGKSKRARRPKEPGPSRPLACPFCKKNLQQYQACVKLNLTKVQYVKQHLHRKHGDDVEGWVMARVRQRSAPGTEEEQWYRIFDLLFPGHSPRPATPYNDFTVSERPQPSPDTSSTEEVLYVPGMFLTREFVQTLEHSLIEDPALVSIAADDIRRALARGLSRAHMEQTSRQNLSVDSSQGRTQHSSETGIECSEESSNSRGLALGRVVSNSHSSDDSAVTNEQTSSTTVQSDPAPDPQRPQHRVGEIAREEELLHNSNLATGRTSQGQQRSHDGQSGMRDGPTVDLLGTGSEWGNLFDADSQGDWWLDGWLAIDSDQSLEENPGVQA